MVREPDKEEEMKSIEDLTLEDLQHLPINKINEVFDRVDSVNKIYDEEFTKSAKSSEKIIVKPARRFK